MGFDQGEIIVDSPTGAYFAGQFVDGRLVFDLQKVKKFRGIYFTVKGFCKVHWTTSHSRKVNDRTEHYTVNHDSFEEYISLKMYLIGSKNSEHSLNPGRHEFPFKFQLPPSCPSSFEGSVGHVRYELRAVMDVPYATDKEVFRSIRVMAPLDLNTLDCKDPEMFEFEQTYCCWCCNSGGSETLVKLPARGFCPGQVIPIEVVCKNKSSVEIDYISFKIKKEVSYRAEREPGSKEETHNVLELKKGPVAPHTDRSWTVEMTVPEMDVQNMDTCSFIDVEYEFKVTVSPSGCHNDDDDSCTIFFGTVPLGDFSTTAGNVIPNQIHQTNTQQAYPPASNPYPQPIINQPAPSNPPYQPNSPFPPNPYPSNSPYPSPNPPHASPYPGNAPYPNSSPYPGHNSPYPGSNAPYPNNPQLSPYPSNNAPYPNPTPGTGSPYNNAPYPNTSPYPARNTSEMQQSSPYPNPPYPIGNSPYPRSNSPYPPDDKPALGLGMLSPGNHPSVPLLPPGSVPYPVGPSSGRSSPFAGASAPAVATPENELQKPFDNDHTNSPFNPAFMDDKKEAERKGTPDKVEGTEKVDAAEKKESTEDK